MASSSPRRRRARPRWPSTTTPSRRAAMGCSSRAPLAPSSSRRSTTTSCPGTTGASGIVVTGPNVFFDAVPGGSLDPVAGGTTTSACRATAWASAGMLLTTRHRRDWTSSISTSSATTARPCPSAARASSRARRAPESRRPQGWVGSRLGGPAVIAVGRHDRPAARRPQQRQQHGQRRVAHQRGRHVHCAGHGDHHQRHRHRLQRHRRRRRP